MGTEIVFLIVYFLIIVILGLYSFFRIKTSNDFYTAGKTNGVLSVSGSLLATILGGSAILGTVNLGLAKGWASAWWILCGIIGLAVLLPLAKKVRKFGKFTLPQMIGDFYGKEAEVISSIMIPIAWIGIVAAQIIGASKILVSFFGLEYTIGVIIVGIIFIAYTILGGQVSIIKTDVIQIFLILSGVFITFLFANSSANYQTANLTDLGFPFNEYFGIFDLVVLLLTLSTTYFVGPDIYSRLFCAKDENTAQRSVLITIIILIPFAFILSYLGVFARANFADMKDSAALLNIVFHVLPKWGIGLMAAALLSAVMSSADTTLLTASAILSELFTDINKNRSIIMTRIFILVLGILSMIFSLFVTSIIGSLLIALTMFAGAFIIPTAAGLLGYRASKYRIVPAIVAGGLIALTGKLITMKSGMSGNVPIGNTIILVAFIVNAAILFFPKLKSE